jgi:NMD protein affecting ribosome stability and mRNA decay
MYGKDKLIKEKRHDAYPAREKWPEPTVCTVCGSRFVGGRWTWEAGPDAVHETVCPACRRIRDDFPAGYVQIRGLFLTGHQEEIHNLIRNIEAAEKEDHPLERLIAVKNEDGGLLVTTTGIHVARRIGEALERAYQGELTIQYAEGTKRIRIDWER